MRCSSLTLQLHVTPERVNFINQKSDGRKMEARSRPSALESDTRLNGAADGGESARARVEDLAQQHRSPVHRPFGLLVGGRSARARSYLPSLHPMLRAETNDN